MSIALYLLSFCFKIIGIVHPAQKQDALAILSTAQTTTIRCSPVLCETIKIECNSSNYTIENAHLLKIDVEIKNCLDTVFKLSVDANVGKKNNHNACFTIDLKKYKRGKWVDVDELNNDLDFFNIRGFLSLKPNESYHYPLFPFKYLYPTPKKGRYQIIVYFYNHSTDTKHPSNAIEITVV